MGQFGMGQPVRRVEDQRFVTGTGRYTDDIALPRQAHGFVLRSPHAHARLDGIDTTAAKAAPGVLAVYTAADIAAAGLGTIPCPVDMKNLDGTPIAKPLRPILAEGRVRHVGDPVAFVVAETLEQARDAAELVEIDYTDLPAVPTPVAAVAKDAPLVWDEAPGNLCLSWGNGDEAKTDAAFARAARTVTIELVNNRVVSNPMEPRNALADWDGKRLTLYTSSQGSHGLRGTLAKMVMKIPAEQLRVVTPDVGGGFGTKIFVYPEQPLVLFAAKQLGRPVKWTGERLDSFLSDAHGRDNVTTARAAIDADGRILAIKVDNIANLGAYLSQYGPFVATQAGTGMMCGVYAIPAAYVRVRGVFTNTVPVDAYRGAGRPEAAYLIERLIDSVAYELGRDPAEIRRINFIKPSQMPFTTPLNHTYDSGDFARNMDDALRFADRPGFAARKAEAARRGKLRGLGMATYIEACGGGSDETATVKVGDDGKVVVHIGSQNNGQGHETAYSQLVADRLGIDIARVQVLQGDTDVVATGRGTGGSRALPVGGAALDIATKQVVEKGKRLAAHYLETAAADIEFADATFTVAGTDRRMTLADVAKRAATSVPEGETTGLEATDKWQPPNPTYPNGCHVAEVEIDPDTGRTEIVSFTVVDDFGNIVNPMMLAGQVHGGIAQGVGQALMEGVIYDDGGQLVTGSFMDYCMPRADNLPHIEFRTNVVPCVTNPLGVKGAGEAGAIGAPPAVVNAIVDALSDLGIRHVDMPVLPEKLWRAIQERRVSRAAE